MRVNPVAGVRLAAGHAGLYTIERPDVALLELAPGSQMAAVFTRNRFQGAPLQVARQHLAQKSPRLLVINAGCANAGVGAQGVADAQACCEYAAEVFGIEVQEVLPFSTGVIGERLAVDRIKAMLPQLKDQLAPEQWPAAAEAIRTTDTYAKLHSVQMQTKAGSMQVTGMAKGSGMICPDMATLLAFIATDLEVEADRLQQTLYEVLPDSFHAITVDGETSPNDACVLIATGQSGVAWKDLSEVEQRVWHQAVHEVCRALAKEIVRDGEGATRFITVEVEQAPSDDQAQAVARAVAHSPLVKTAAFAGDPNWGRILSAVGGSIGPEVVLEKISIHLDDEPVVQGGALVADYREDVARDVMSQSAFRICINLQMGEGRARVYTSDLSYEYVKINAEYRS